MTIYAWTTDNDDVAFDAITVVIGAGSPALIVAGLTSAYHLANIFWPDWVTQGDKVLAAMEGPYPVEEALRRADSLCYLWAFSRVVIQLPDRSTWRREWGELREIEGLD